MHAVAFPHAVNPCVVATGGKEKKLRIWDFGSGTTGTNGVATANGAAQPEPTGTPQDYELAAGEHGGPIKSIVWNMDPNVITSACEDRKIRWFDLRQNIPFVTKELPSQPSSMELTTHNSSNVLSVTAGKKVYLFNGAVPGMLTKEIEVDHEAVSAAVDTKSNTLLTGAAGDTWVHVWDIAQGRETGEAS